MTIVYPCRSLEKILLKARPVGHGTALSEGLHDLIAILTYCIPVIGIDIMTLSVRFMAKKSSKSPGQFLSLRKLIENKDMVTTLT